VEVLIAGWPVTARTRRRLRRAIGHVLDFRTWQSLHSQGCSNGEAVALMLVFARAAATPADD
jgi:hypothetical protein